MGPIWLPASQVIPTQILPEAFSQVCPGLGVSAPIASWGTLCNDALEGYLPIHPTFTIPHMAAISLTILTFNLLGDGLRDALDPKLRK